MRVKTFLTAGAIAVCGHAAGASPFSDLYSSFWSLGDSLTDNGNAFAFAPALIPSPPYFDGRVSNGPTYAESLADDFEAQGKATGNLAFAGALATTNADPIPDLSAQAFSLVPLYIDGQMGLTSRAAQFGSRPLVSIFAGSNDVLGALGGGVDPVAAASAAATTVADTVKGLSSVSKDFLLFNLPDFAEIPRLNGQSPAVRALATIAAQTFQTTLESELAVLPPQVNVTMVDVFSELQNIVADPAGSGLINATDACLTFGVDGDGAPTVSSCATPSTFAFYDDIHPSDTVHLLLAQAAREAVAPIPLPAAGWALLAGLGGLAALSRRRAG
jgi:phospholipase/lecithinase/hemolysin